MSKIEKILRMKIIPKNTAWLLEEAAHKREIEARIAELKKLFLQSGWEELEDYICKRIAELKQELKGGVNANF